MILSLADWSTVRWPISYHLCSWKASPHSLIWTYLTANITIADMSVLITHERAVRNHLAHGPTPCLWFTFISSQIHNKRTLRCPSALANTGPINISPSKTPRCQEASNETPANNSYHLMWNTSSILAVVQSSMMSAVEGFIILYVLACVCCLTVLHVGMQ